MTTVPGVAARAVVVMGVSGSGRTTVAVDLARRLGWEFAEGDEHHPPADVEKMRAGIPLDDADREPWLRGLARCRAHRPLHTGVPAGQPADQPRAAGRRRARAHL
jgi:predicted kinase